MSWLARSLANSLRLEEEDDDEDDNLENDALPDDNSPRSSMPRHESQGNVHISPSSSSSSSEAEPPQARGVKEDLTELGNTLTRQFWGVANFLAPPPDAHDDNRLGSSVDRLESGLNRSGPSDDRSESGTGNGLQGIGDRVGSAKSQAPEMALDYDPFGSEENERENLGSAVDVDHEFVEEEEKDEEIDVVGITDEVLAFAKNIARHPETWLDFPLDPDEDLDDFNMSDAQKRHALAIEHFSPRLAALRIELCPCHMSLGYFWKVYFVLLHSRLNKHDTEMLSTPQVMEARALWMKELQKLTKPKDDLFERSISSLKGEDTEEEDVTQSSSNYYAPPEFLSPRIYAFEPPSILNHDHETVKHTSENREAQFVDKVVIEEVPVHKTGTTDISSNQLPKAQPLIYGNGDDDDDDWPEDEYSAYGGCTRVPIFTVDEDDVSFSDLEGDDDISSLALKSKMTSKITEPRIA